MDIRRISASNINPAPYNPRKDLRSGDPEYEKLKQSLSEFGYIEPLVWNERTGNLVGGHQRFKILMEQGLTEVEVSVVDLDHEKEKALNLALNKISGDWDQQALANLLQDIHSIDNHLIELTGFDDYEVQRFIKVETDRGEESANQIFHSIQNHDDPTYTDELQEVEDDFEGPDSINIDTMSSDIRKITKRMMTFGKYKIQMTEEEYEALEETYLQYIDEKKTPFGFVLYLLGGGQF